MTYSTVALIFGILFSVLGVLILLLRKKVLMLIRKRYETLGREYEAEGRVSPQVSRTVPGPKFVLFIGLGTLLIAVLTLWSFMDSLN